MNSRILVCRSVSWSLNLMFISRSWWGDVDGILANQESKRKLLFVLLTDERPFARVTNVCTPPATGSHDCGQPVPAAFGYVCCRRWAWSWRRPSASRGGRTADTP